MGKHLNFGSPLMTENPHVWGILSIPSVKVAISLYQDTYNERERESTNCKPMGNGAKYGNNP